MQRHIARGLPADWINGWLAAIGVTVLCPEVKLSWTNEPRPVAVFWAPPDVDVAELVASRWPTAKDIGELAIASWPDDEKDEMKLTRSRYEFSATKSRHDPNDASLSSFTSDMKSGKYLGGKVDAMPRSNFYPSAPRGRTLFQRLSGCLETIEQFAEPHSTCVQKSFSGVGEEAQIMGLGFNPRRAAAFISPDVGGSSATGTTEPIVEMLTFFGLSLFPLRGDGRNVRQKGWSRTSNGKYVFCWPAWRMPLDRWAIDGFLDSWLTNARQTKMNVVAAFESVLFDAEGNNQLRAIMSRRVS